MRETKKAANLSLSSFRMADSMGVSIHGGMKGIVVERNSSVDG